MEENKKTFLQNKDVQEKKQQETAKNELQEITEQSNKDFKDNFKFEIDKNKTPFENTKEALKMYATGKASADENYINEVAGEIQKQIKDDVEADRKIGKTKKSTESIENQNKKAGQFYNSFKPVFEFTNLQSACGILLMKVILATMILPFLSVKLISGMFKMVSELFDGINGLFTSVTQFNKPLKNLLGAVFYVSVGIIIVLSLIYGVEYLFNISVLPN